MPAAIRRERTDDDVRRDRQALSTERLREPFQVLYQVRWRGAVPERDDIDTALGRIAAELAAHRDLLVAVVMSPDTALETAAELTGRRQQEPADQWMALCWLAEAAWEAVTGPPGGGRSPQAVSPEDRRLLYPLAARLRFLALSEPFRDRGLPERTALRRSAFGSTYRGSPVDRLYGEGSWNVLVDHARQARADWLACLDAYQSHPYLAQAPAAALEEELSLLVFTRGRGSAPLSLTGRDPDLPAVLGAGDVTFIGDVVERHLLPRFDLPSVAVLGWRAHPGPASHRRRRCTFLIGALMIAIPPVAIFASLWWATGLAAVAYGLLGLGVVAFGGTWAALWMLRLPAASSIGLLVLLTLPEHWWQSARPGWGVAVLAPVVLAVAAFGYLLLEARNHGIGRRATAVRALAVTGVGAVHAFAVALIGLVAVAPAFTAKGRELGRLLTGTQDGRHLLVLAMATAWCLAVGVFSQILWDDRPISAPLAHTDWRSAA
ncbi:hypothetical protein [Thermomonospora cellulosilytica]|uniref:Uncharacterized protein n=1 Tax=Thermomonospora cellulosilytica TaxID=1411118 RepID=A0A7W3RBA9_9ACTN|nr:hypothetical protein [Thermomonospora cellulosilytica]MBA9007288.1 hypothetical protein [Thermomonospora cellulosilytica]